MNDIETHDDGDTTDDDGNDISDSPQVAERSLNWNSVRLFCEQCNQKAQSFYCAWRFGSAPYTCGLPNRPPLADVARSDIVSE
jgi:hypothetical protein